MHVVELVRKLADDVRERDVGEADRMVERESRSGIHGANHCRVRPADFARPLGCFAARPDRVGVAHGRCRARSVSPTLPRYAASRLAFLRSCSFRWRLRMRIDCGVTSTSSSSAMNSTAYSSVSCDRRHQAHRFVGARRAHVGELLALDRVDDEVVVAAVDADDHAFVQHLAGRRRTCGRGPAASTARRRPPRRPRPRSARRCGARGCRPSPARSSSNTWLMRPVPRVRFMNSPWKPMRPRAGIRYSRRVRPWPSDSMLVRSPRRVPSASITAPWWPSSTSTDSDSYGSQVTPSIVAHHDARPRYRELVAFAAHVLDQDGEVQLAAARHQERVGVAGVLDAQRHVRQQLLASGGRAGCAT